VKPGETKQLPNFVTHAGFCFRPSGAMTQDAAIVQMATAVDKETVDNSSSIHASFDNLPDACLILIWKFVALEFVACKSSEVEDQFVDLKSMASMSCITTKAKESFQSGQGWLLHAKALKMNVLQNRSSVTILTVPWATCDHVVLVLWCSKQGMLPMNSSKSWFSAGINQQADVLRSETNFF
jgi:hypothetical protein